jgi:hypothetical protein
MTIHIAGLTIKQSSNGLYSVNDLHRASGGLNKDQPSKWLNSQATINLIRELESESQELNSAITHVIETIKGNSPSIEAQGTFVSRELVVSYAMWISPKFYKHVVRTFLEVVDGVYARIAEQERILEQKALQLDIFSGELASMRKRDPRGRLTLPVLAGMEARKCKPLFDQLVEEGYLESCEYYANRTQYKPTDKAYDAGLIAEIKNRTIHFTPKVLTILGLER